MSELADKLSAMETWERADFVLDVLDADDENARGRPAGALEEMGSEGRMSIIDALARARQRQDGALEDAVLGLTRSR